MFYGLSLILNLTNLATYRWQLTITYVFESSFNCTISYSYPNYQTIATMLVCVQGHKQLTTWKCSHFLFICVYVCAPSLIPTLVADYIDFDCVPLNVFVWAFTKDWS